MLCLYLPRLFLFVGGLFASALACKAGDKAHPAMNALAAQLCDGVLIGGECHSAPALLALHHAISLSPISHPRKTLIGRTICQCLGFPSFCRFIYLVLLHSIIQSMC